VHKLNLATIFQKAVHSQKARSDHARGQNHVFARTDHEEGFTRLVLENARRDAKGSLVVLQFQQARGLTAEGVDDTNAGRPLGHLGLDGEVIRWSGVDFVLFKY